LPADEAIIQSIEAGRAEEAFERLVPAYRRRVFGLAYGILGDRAAAEDLAQEVFVKLWQALPRYDGRARLSTWIYAITRNAAVSALRNRRPALSMSDPAVFAQAERATADVPAEAEDAALRRAIVALPEKQRLAVTLYYLDERTVEEVAEMMGAPVNTVKTHLHRSRAALAAALGAAGKRSHD
jgi:RNA polymerase sigma-70 factor (ECF subfamily)